MSASTWMQAACGLLRLEPAIVRITLGDARGSVPRELGATLLVTPHDLWGTIGGGNLEWQAIEQARVWLREGRHAAARVLEQRLGPDLAQCCGGVVSLWMERLPRAGLPELEQRLATFTEPSPSAAVRTVFLGGHLERYDCEAPVAGCQLRRHGDGIELVERWRDAVLPLWLFGAGHVGQAVMRALVELPLFDVLCLDSRPNLLTAPTASHIHTRCMREPVEAVGLAPRGAAWLVMTHDHELDYQICAAVLARGDARWLGLIGSASKAARFRSRLARDGFTAAQVQSLCSPVGIAGVPGKLPAAIAVSIAAQLLTLSAQPELRLAAPCDPDCRRCTPGEARADRRPADLAS